MYFEFIKNIFAKRVLLTLLTALTLISYTFISYTLVRSNLYAFQGRTELRSLVAKTAFVGNDQTPEKMTDQNIKNAKKSDEIARSFIKYLDSNYSYSMHIVMNANLGTAEYSIHTVNEDFFNFYNIKIGKGHNFTKTSFKNNGYAPIPVLVGPNLHRFAHVGKTYKIYNSGTGKNEKIKVIGILAKNNKIASIYEPDSYTYFNNAIIRPLRSSDKKTFNAVELYSGLQDLLVYRTSLANVKKIQKYLAKRSFANVKFYSAKNNLEEFYTSYTKRSTSLLIFSLIIFFISSWMISVNLWKSLEEERQNIALRVSLGMRPTQIYTAAILYQFILTIVIMIPVSLYSLAYSRMLTSGAVQQDSRLMLSSPLPGIEGISLLICFIFIFVFLVLISVILIYRFNKEPLLLRMSEK
ncbi:FtsX-like permease family protein [Lactobacillus corticis]|uniref:Permease n=1 Tax=Lactobacillus corticis TaxID=2201249 RepID=A0A916QFQ6_9LACO|nr:ABC transporter permease [Lactobacillus corticis]GFZ26465.1 permease [Lactobacillus corticis]